MGWPAARAERLSWVWLGLLCLYALLHSAFYALNNPVFESPDEPDHLAFVNRIASGEWLPNQFDASFTPEGHQHPLYYLLTGGILRIAGGPVSVDLPRSGLPFPAPHFNHSPDPFTSPRDRGLFFGLRLLGAVMAALTTLQIGRASRKLMPLGHVWLVAPLVVATLPQFAFISSSISNDGLVLLLGACLTYASVSCAFESERRSHWIALGVWLGLALLTKKSALAYVPAVVVLAAVLALSKSLSPVGIAKRAGMALAIAALLFLPILIRNQTLYGELLASRMEVATLPNLAQAHSLDSPYFQTVFPESVPRSFIAQLGWMNILADPTHIWWIVRALLLAIGLSVIALFDRARRAGTAFCWAAFIGSVAGLVYYNLMFPQPQGRLLFPALAPISLLCALGLHEMSRRMRIPFKWIAIGVMGLYLIWFDRLAYQTNHSFYDWFATYANLGR